MGFMKSTSFVFLLSLSAALYGAEEKKAPQGALGGVVINESLQRMIEIKGVKPFYDKCEKKYSTIDNLSERGQETFKCLWEDVSRIPKLKEQVLQAYKEETKKSEHANNETPLTQTTTLGRAPASTNTESLIEKKHNVGNDYGSDPAVKALSDFFGKKLDEVLNPQKALTKDEIKNGAILSVDHKKFIELYKSELGKTIISAFTSYCIDTDPNKLKCSKVNDEVSCKGAEVIIDEDEETRKNHRKQNIDSLKVADLNDNSVDSVKWKYCISKVTPNCKDGNSNKESSKRACLIVDYVQAAKQNIMIADNQIEDYKLLEAGASANLASNIKFIQDPKKYSNDEILELTSKDVKDTLKDPVSKMEKELEACYKGKEIVDAEACKKFLNTNTDESAKSLVELQMRQSIQEEKLTNALKSDDQVKEYLKQEGYDKKSIESLTSDKTAIEKARSEILDRFKAQKEAIIKEMAAKIQRTVSSEDGKITNTAPDKSKLEKIKEELGSRKGELANLVQFNNIVSSYIALQDLKTGKSAGRNTASLFAETDSMDADEAKVLINNRKAAKIKENSSSNDLSVQSINEGLINYEFQAKKNDEKNP